MIRSHLALRYREIGSKVGFLLVLVSAYMLLPLAGLAAYPEEAGAAAAFALPALAMAALGLVAWRLLHPRQQVVLTVREGGVIVLVSWILVSIFSAWPFMRLEGLSFTQAVFESVSGWTTTGLSVVDVTGAFRITLLWRSLTQLAGGAGLAIIMLSAIAGPTGPAVSVAEGRDLLVPHVRESAKLVMRIYSVYAVLGVLGLWLAGMDWFSAVNHAFAAISTGGFSTEPASIGHWDSPQVEAVTIVLMLLGSISFVTIWSLIRGKLRTFLRNGEIRLVALLLPVSAVLLLLLTTRGLSGPSFEATRSAVFQAATALTTTGFSTTGFGVWNSFGWGMIILLMVIGGGTCSTAGGIKQYRILLMAKSVGWEVRRHLLPGKAVVPYPVWVGDRKVFVSEGHLRSVGTFVFLYIASLAAGTAVLAAHGGGLRDSLFEFASTLGTVGLSTGMTSPQSPQLVLWTQTVGMLLGRLEFFVVIVSIRKVAGDLLRIREAAAG
ncbi:MAG: potassium transporter TrkG [Candidatus Fermentibacteraceae bacterium]